MEAPGDRPDKSGMNILWCRITPGGVGHNISTGKRLRGAFPTCAQEMRHQIRLSGQQIAFVDRHFLKKK